MEIEELSLQLGVIRLEPHTLLRVIRRPASVRCWISPSSRCRSYRNFQYQEERFKKYPLFVKVEPGKRKANLAVQIYPEENLLNKVKWGVIYFVLSVGCFLFLSDISRTNKSGGGQILSVSFVRVFHNDSTLATIPLLPVIHIKSESEP